MEQLWRKKKTTHTTNTCLKDQNTLFFQNRTKAIRRHQHSRFWNGGCCTFDWCRLDKMIVAPFLLKKLREMVLAIQNALKGCIIWWSYRTTTVWTLETWFVIGLAFYCHLLQWISSFATCSTLFLGPRKHARSFARGPCQHRGCTVSYLCRWLEVLVLAKVAMLLEELLKMRLTVKNTFHWWIAAKL